MAAAFAKRLLDAFVDAGLDRQQCDFDEAAGQMIINSDITRVVPIATLFAQYSLCADEAARSKLVDGAMKAFVEGAADVPSSIAETGDRLLPQLWNKQKIAARQMTLPAGFELPHCGLRGELPLDGDLGVVLVCDYGVDGLSIETPVLSKDLSRWGLSFTAALGKALENLRARTKKGPSADRHWEHHPTGCGESCWKDRFDAVRIAVFPKLVATRKRPDGVAEQGGSDGFANGFHRWRQKKGDAPITRVSRRMSLVSAQSYDSREATASQLDRNGDGIPDLIIDKIRELEEDPNKYVLTVDVASVMWYSGVNESPDDPVANPSAVIRGLLPTPWMLSGSWNLMATRGLKSSKTATTFKTKSHSSLSVSHETVKVKCYSLEVDQLADAMCASWLPVTDVLEGIQTDLCAKVASFK